MEIEQNNIWQQHYDALYIIFRELFQYCRRFNQLHILQGSKAQAYNTIRKHIIKVIC
jgi:hypothetical protein